MFRALFLDRDGVIIENQPNYVRSWQEVIFLPGALDALAMVSKTSDVKIVLVSNQAVIGRGYIDLKECLRINDQIISVITSSGGRIDGSFICPHAPEDNCDCRKPKPGLLLRASRELGLDLCNSMMVGDGLTDLQAGFAAGVGRNVLVLSGRGRDQLKLPLAKTLPPFEVFKDLSSFIQSVFVKS